MANTVLQSYMDANPGKGPVEAAVEVILDNLSAGAAGGLTNAQLRASAVPVSLTTALTAAVGTISDAAWSGTGDASVISLLKKIALNTTA